LRSLGVGSPPIHRFDLIYRERDRLWLAEFGEGALGILARFPFVCLALSPPVKLKSVE